MATLILTNTTASQLSYVSGNLIVPANGSLTVPVAYQTLAAENVQLKTDVNAGNLLLSDGVMSWGLEFLNTFIPALSQDSINNSTQQQTISVGTSYVSAIGGESILAGRKSLMICPTNGTIYWSISSSLTTSTGFPIFQNQVLQLSFTDAVPIYLISAGNINTIVLEGS